MKYICKKNCYVRNPQGRFQYFRENDVVDYAGGTAVPVHFEPVDGLERPAEGAEPIKNGDAENEIMRRKLKKVSAE